MGMIGRRSSPSAQDADKPRGFDDFELRLGDVMRGERATMGKSLLDVQRELRIKASYIAAIETGASAAEALVHLRKRYEGRGVHVVKVGDAWAIRTASASAAAGSAPAATRSASGR